MHNILFVYADENNTFFSDKYKGIYKKQFIYLFHSLSYDEPTASSKPSSPYSAI